MNMRVLLATDLSRCAELATRLAASLPWPKNTTILVLGVIESARPVVDIAPDGTAGSDERGAREFTFAVRLVAEGLAAPGRTVETLTQLGRPADAIVEEAARFRADLVIMGSRGRGPIRSALLGSVSAEVVDRAPCPVLIARRERISSVVFGADGATRTAEAADVLTWPLFASLPMRVVSVAKVDLPYDAVAEPRAKFEAAVRSYLRAAHDAETNCERFAREKAAQLVAMGMKATSEVRLGSPASAILAAADDFGADLIVVGSRGDRGLQRMVVGSTAREILYDASCSVLIARQQPAVELDEVAAFALGYAS
jgi:nucleotide-binding universal stress UspA family protein